MKLDNLTGTNTVTDFNAVVDTSFYTIGNPNVVANAPPPTKTGVLLTFKSGVYTVQLFIATTEIYFRQYNNGSWAAWNVK